MDEFFSLNKTLIKVRLIVLKRFNRRYSYLRNDSYKNRQIQVVNMYTHNKKVPRFHNNWVLSEYTHHGSALVKKLMHFVVFSCSYNILSRAHRGVTRHPYNLFWLVCPSHVPTYLHQFYTRTMCSVPTTCGFDIYISIISSN